MVDHAAAVALLCSIPAVGAASEPALAATPGTAPPLEALLISPTPLAIAVVGVPSAAVAEMAPLT